MLFEIDFRLLAGLCFIWILVECPDIDLKVERNPGLTALTVGLVFVGHYFHFNLEASVFCF